ncbi:MAG: hypothetical protein SFX73_39890 [Kofleriaceae bacterium]|nr:hypothetical protein [Kofleriaceae bacterium]
MRRLGLVLFLVACGGSAKPASTIPANDAPDPFPTRTTVSEPTPAPPQPPASFCDNHPDPIGPFVLTASLAEMRRGLGAKTYADAPSSKQEPLEVCGPDASYQWLILATCKDGSHPIPSTMEARKSRAGNVGAGGRCGSIIDHYVVTCPEAAYDVYMDMYMCGPDESFLQKNDPPYPGS